MDTATITAFVTLLTPLAALAGVIFTMMRSRTSKLENENAELVGFVLTTCADRSEGLEKLANIIVAGRKAN